MTRKKDKIPDRQGELIDQLIQESGGPQALFAKGGLLEQLKKRLIETVLEGELDEHLGYQKHAPIVPKSGNSRNGHGSKTIIVDNDQLEINPPRDRNSTFEPQLIPKRQTRFKGFDEKILAMYARGMSVRDMQAMLLELYQVEVSEALISSVTDAVLGDVRAWQSRPLDAVYPIVYFDCIVVKSRQEGKVSNKAVYLALAITMEGQKELLGLWISQNEGAKFWLGIMTELKNRGVEDILIAAVDGLVGFPDAIAAVFPETEVQLCIVHMVRNSTKFVSWKDRKELCADLKMIYGSASAGQAELNLQAFADKWDAKYPSVSKLWYRHWENIIPFFDYSAEIRKVIYTTNAIESLNRSLRKVLKTKGAFPNDESIMKLIYLAMQNIAKKWTMPLRNWGAVINQFSIKFEGRLPV
ncbi:IS256 family transposase [Chlorobaculum thiosulfatiphilum]|uniref:Mutator family transposase n=1 Tax=Chlorobaculum thiosulfatiphilum TaxID=115852 RepID=A0A5C4RXE7_CHLTI|nr:IS256 family transposase [Chlorobaculum thiosulfatiphilum]TNJ35966.1 IS256 family transposase [Chlorobaculum thiosulfatiphilum]